MHLPADLLMNVHPAMDAAVGDVLAVWESRLSQDVVLGMRDGWKRVGKNKYND